MMGPQHRLFGGLCGAAVATYQGASFTMIAMTAMVATASAHGWSSPDVDQTGPWRRVARVLPGPLGRAMKHRGISHWPGWVALAWFGISQAPAEAQWPLTALLIGWASHIVGDVLFGTVPLMPWGSMYVGVGLDTGGFLETRVARALTILTLTYLLYLPFARVHDLPYAT
jgi:hypothetical protein